jgi:hypothetical protein
MGRFSGRKRHLKAIARNRETEKRTKKGQTSTENHLPETEGLVEDMYIEDSNLEEASDIDWISSDDEPDFSQYESVLTPDITSSMEIITDILPESEQRLTR